MSKGTILEIRPQVVLVDIGYKYEGAISSNGFADEEIAMGDEIEVNPLFPASSPATSSFNGLHPQSKY